MNLNTKSSAARASVSSGKFRSKRSLKISIFVIVCMAGLIYFLIGLPVPQEQYNGAVDPQTANKPRIESTLQVSTDPVKTVNTSPQADPAKPPALTTETPLKEDQPSATDNALSIAGMVVDEMGLGIPDIELVAHRKHVFPLDRDTEPDRKTPSLWAMTDPYGLYEIEGVPDGDYRIQTQATDLYEAAQIVVKAGLETADLVLIRRQAQVEVFGVVSSTGEPLADVQVQVIGQPDGVVHSDTGGYYQLAFKVSGSKPAYTVRFTRNGYREKRSVLELVENQMPAQVKLDAELEPSRDLVEVSGTLRNKKGRPVPGETVQLYSEAARQRYSALSDNDGEFWFAQVETDPGYMLSIHPADTYRDFYMRNLEITLDGADLQIVLEPLATGQLSGQMVDPTGQPVPGYTLWLRNADVVNQAIIPVTGDSQGYFSVDRLTEGSLVFETHSFPRHSISGIYLSAGEKKSVRLILDWGFLPVAGVVVDEVGAPVTATELFLSSVRHDNGVWTHAIRKAITDESGYFLFTQVGPGYHTIRIDTPGFNATIFDHDVAMGTPEVIIHLERASVHGM